MKWERLENIPLHERIYNRLRVALMAGEFAPGERLNVRKIAEQLGISPMPVRDALRRLEAQSVITIEPQKAPRVAALSPAEFVQIAEMRKMLEGRAISLAAERATPKPLRELRRFDEAARKDARAGRAKESMEQNFLFHQMAVNLSGEPLLVDVIEGLWLRVGPYLNAAVQQDTPVDPQAAADRFRHHDEILAGLDARDGKATAHALQADIDEGTTFYLAAISRFERESVVPARRSRQR